MLESILVLMWRYVYFQIFLFLIYCPDAVYCMLYRRNRIQVTKAEKMSVGR